MLIRSHVLALTILFAPAAFADAARGANDPGAAVPPLGGPVIEGVCLLSRDAVLANAKIGHAATARLQVLAREAQAEVDAERAPIDTDLQTYQSEQAGMTPQQRETRKQALDARLRSVQAKAAQRSREIDATRAKALARISQEAQPVIAEVYKSKKCGLIVDRNTVLGGNMSNDLTAAVVQALDAKISTLTFDRETLPPQTAAAR